MRTVHPFELSVQEHGHFTGSKYYRHPEGGWIIQLVLISGVLCRGTLKQIGEAERTIFGYENVASYVGAGAQATSQEFENF